MISVRAGYWGDEAQFVDWGEGERNPFTEGIHRIAASAMTGQAANSCITYSYNLDNDGVDDDDAIDARIGVCSGCTPSSAPFNDGTVYDVGNMEMFGFRLSGNAVQMRSGVASAADTTFDCDSGNWAGLSDNNVVNVTSLVFYRQHQYDNYCFGNE